MRRVSRQVPMHKAACIPLAIEIIPDPPAAFVPFVFTICSAWLPMFPATSVGEEPPRGSNQPPLIPQSTPVATTVKVAVGPTLTV